MNENLQTQVRQWIAGLTTAEDGRRIAGGLLERLVEGETPAVAPDGAYLRQHLPSRSAEDYRQAVAGAIRKAKRVHAQLAEERRECAPVLRSCVEDRPEAASTPSHESWAFVHGLTIENWEIDHPDPPRAVKLARVGVDLATALDERKHGVERVHDLRALAYAKLGNALRIQSDFRRAEVSFAQASTHLTMGSGDPLVRARVQLAKMSFYGNLERFGEAFELADRVVATARRFEDDHLLGKALLSRAYFESNAGHLNKALRLSYEGLRYIDERKEPRLVLVAWHNLILTLTYQDRYKEAVDRLPHVRSLHAKYGNRLDRLRLEWVEARVDLAQGKQDEAEAALERVRESFIRSDVGFDAALVSLDLAHAYAKQDRSEDMRRLAEQMIPIFESRDMHREAIAALLVFQRATEMDRVNVQFVEEVASFLRRSRGNPQLRFQPGE